MLGYGIYGNPRRSMTERAAPMKMGGAKPDHVWVVELRHYDAAGVSRHRAPHAEIEKALYQRPVTLARRDISKSRPGKRERP